MKNPRPFRFHFRFRIVLGLMLGAAALAGAHHGNSQAPAAPPWYGYLPAGTQVPAPLAPGR